MFRGVFFSLAALLLIVGSTGCTKRAKLPSQAEVKGTVNLDGKAMPDGDITFSLPGEVPSSLPIQNGSFSGKAPIGKNRVEVRAYKAGTPTKMGDQTFGGEKENYIPAQYNTGSTMSADVVSGGANDFKFDVTSK